MRWFFLPILFTLVACNEEVPRRSLATGKSSTPVNVKGKTAARGLKKRAANDSVDVTSDKSASSSLHARCQSAVRCLYAQTPAYSQGDNRLENYIGKQIGNPKYVDTGLCAPTAMGVMIKAILSERHIQTNLNNAFLEGFDNRQWFENVYQIAVDSNTNFDEGGTYLDEVGFTMREYFQDVIPKIGIKHHIEGYSGQEPVVANSEIISFIKSRKYAYLASVDVARNAGGHWVRDVGAHMVVIKGFDGDRLHIQDPWGMDYFARIEKETLKINGQGLTAQKSVFKPVTSTGFMGSYGQTNKLILYSLLGISLD